MNRRPSHIVPPALAAALLLLAAMALLSACGGSPPVYVQQYVFAYAPPSPAGVKPLAAAVKVQRFGALPQFSSQRMFYMPGSYQMNSYANHRWQGYPSDMVAGLLARDMADSGRFAAVFGPSSPQTPRFVLEGGLVKCWEDDRAGGPTAQLEVDITLLDIQQGETVKRVMFQKKYGATRDMAAKKAQSLAQAMSQAMAQISPQVAQDVYQAVALRLDKGAPPLEKPILK
ncbi:MAG: ABC-type transport auxiliary lipoprotein family protein [Desulfarculaceae bacterium]|nr:ABC-type transport auxiliary lipoprotein family protein [Desulfarculaceae bacterium]MCF8048687.1 ABC-type transport auxiliary lipoprotein family protein [Desulfarculaceae bacterium]MCF8096422.1 ABC-type transport auxiliary lipoprotein family protein [Desulfarculaceae bacterium]MCF8121899.1 ABC-type transport auxiliary lipoprotein family protein [Desulfarculaceae bacterium]